MADRTLRHFGNYRLVRLLGQGGYAEVYLGQHLRLNQQAAIKVLHAHLTETEAEHFQQEAQTISTLVHPSIIRIFDYDVQDGTPFLVMDYAPNGSLRQRYPKGSQIPLPQVLSFVKQVADALQYAHEQKFIHRDVKPENMLVGRREEVLLSDFGIATVAHSTASLSSQSTVGTIIYMAPEQIGGHPRPASDQYALGVVVYEWLCGQRPFQGSFAELVAQHLWHPPPSLQKRMPSISPAIEQVVLRALSKDPKQRFATVQAFAEALEQASQHAPTWAGPLASGPPLPPALASAETIPPSQTGLPIEVMPPISSAGGASDLASSAYRTQSAAELAPPHEPTAEERLAPSSSGVRMAAPQSLEKAIHDPAIPLFVAEGTELVGRDDLVHRLKERLCRGRGVVLIALGGLPGVGKTTLAANVAQDPDILEHFSDGVLWAGLGPNPDVLSHLSRWGMLLGLPAIEATKLTTLEEWITALRLAIGTRRLLLVIDDAWTIEAALAFQVGGLHCAYLMTTRFPPIALQFAADDAIIVPELAEEDGMTLLTRFAPNVVASDPVNARSLVQAVGSLPLALTIMGKYLRKEAYSGQPRRIRAALGRLRGAQERLHLTTPHTLSESTPSLPVDAPISLQTIIEVGVRGLEEQARGALYALSVFPAKPNSFTEEAAAAASAVPVEVLDVLTDAGLLEGSEYGRYTMHQTIADYGRAHLQDGGAYKRFVKYMSQYVVSHTKDYEVLEQESSNIFAALQAASQEERHADLIRCMNAFAPFLLARGLFSLAEEYLLQVERAARSLQDYTGLAAALLYLGRIQYSHGDYSRAETTLQEGLTLARQHEDPERLCRMLHALGTVARYRGAYHQAEAYHQEGLALARQLGDPELISTLLQGLGIDFGESGRYTQEEACYQEGAALARQVGDQERLCELLLDLGQAVYAQGNYTEAMSYSQQALELCRRIGYRHAMTTLLANLGGMAVEQKNYAQAEEYLKEALEIARQMKHRNLIGVSLVNLGGLATEQGNYAQAEAYLQEGLEIARQIGRPWLLCGALHARGDLALKQQEIEQAEGVFQELREIASEDNQEYRAVALYGLARVALAHQDLREARELGQESLRLLEAIGNRQAPEVRDWLQALPLTGAHGSE